jgi:3-hydroxyacyl-CoA dehydrogenase
MDMNAASILRSKTTAIISAGVLGAGLLGGVAVAAVPTTAATVAMTASGTTAANATDEQARAKLKAVLDALVAKNVITQAQEDAIVAALGSVAKGEHPKLRELIGDVAKESVSYLGLPADQVR